MADSIGAFLPLLFVAHNFRKLVGSWKSSLGPVFRTYDLIVVLNVCFSRAFAIVSFPSFCSSLLFSLFAFLSFPSFCSSLFLSCFSLLSCVHIQQCIRPTVKHSFPWGTIPKPFLAKGKIYMSTPGGACQARPHRIRCCHRVTKFLSM